MFDFFTISLTHPMNKGSNAMQSIWLKLAHIASLVTTALALLLTGCAGTPDKRSDRVPHAELLKVPDAQPRIEPLRAGGPNKPYTVLGRSYTPLTTDAEVRESGLASWYGGKFHGLPTASGERYDMYAMTAAHPTMPIPSYARVRNPANGREVIVRINDRGPFSPGRVIDLSLAAAVRLGVSHAVSPVEVERLTHAAILSGNWQR
jgi:rare lipoprotein A (peptidoglycan hydrolase)